MGKTDSFGKTEFHTSLPRCLDFPIKVLGSQVMMIIDVL